MEIFKIGRWLIVAILWMSCSNCNGINNMQCANQELISKDLGCALGKMLLNLPDYISESQRRIDDIGNEMKSLRKETQQYISEGRAHIVNDLGKGLSSLKSDIESSRAQIIIEVNKLKDAIVSANSQKECPQPYVLRGSSCYWFPQEKVTWEAAKRACQNTFGGLLVEINDIEEDNFLNLQMLRHNMVNAWIGLVRNYGDTNKFLWASGKSPSFLNWIIGEPNGFNVEDCGEILRLINEEDCKLHYGTVQSNCQSLLSRSLRWNDKACSVNNNFICKRQL